MKAIVVILLIALAAPFVAAQSAPPAPQSIVSDWTQHHALYPDSKDSALTERLKKDPRWLQDWYLRHRETWWQAAKRRQHSHRDWSVSLGPAPLGPIYDFTFDLPPVVAYGSLNTADQGNGEFLATSGSITITAGYDVGTYPLYPGGPGVTLSPMGAFDYDSLIYSDVNPPLDMDGLLFTGPGLEINIWGNPPTPNNYTFDDYSNGNYGISPTGTGNFSQVVDPGGGETYPALFTYNVNGTPSCTNDFVAFGIPATPAAGGQANIIGVNNLYSGTAGALCTGPTVMFAYASGTGQVPAAIEMSRDGTQLAYIENLSSGSSYLHILTIGTTGTNGTSATAAVVPGSAGGNNAVDQRVLLSPDGGVTNQSSTNAVWIAYTSNDTNDVAYATTYSTAGSGSGYLYKVTNVFNGDTPSIVWSVPIAAIPSTPVYDPVSNKVFFTDSKGRLDYVVDSGTPTVVYGAVLASGATSENPVVIDVTNELVYATFNSNGTNALLVQAPASLASSVSVAVGAAGAVYTSPYQPTFNNAWYTGVGTPMLYIVGTGTGSIPTLYSVGFSASGLLNSAANATSAALASNTANSAPIVAFYNASLGKDFLFASVTNNCIATVGGGTGGCVMSLDITNGFPTIGANSTALPASGGTSGIVIDNDSLLTGASSIYYATQTGATLVKATQSGLN